jgi:hypothetical protein
MEFKSVKAVASYVKDTFAIEMELSQVIRMSAEALKLLKVFATGDYMVVDVIDDYKVTIHNVYKINSVIRLDQPVFPIHVEVQDIAFPPQIIFQVPEVTTATVPADFTLNYLNQIKGPYIDFKWNCPVLSFNETGIKIAAHVVGIKKDAEGYPMIPEHAFLACCYYCAYTHQIPMMLLNKINPNAFMLIKELKDQKFAQARADMTINALNKNEIDKLGDIMSSMDRKAFNVPM